MKRILRCHFPSMPVHMKIKKMQNYFQRIFSGDISNFEIGGLMVSGITAVRIQKFIGFLFVLIFSSKIISMLLCKISYVGMT